MTQSAPSIPKPGDTETPDLQGLLPAGLRSRWCAVPRFELGQVFGVGALFGAGLSLMIAGVILPIGPLR